ncbi:hypothetical protein SO694_00156020 [Aureococcus anophagefferens]|uniref:Uncharacterized protein n=1 Tax=Aureococcus anophagefferens TaxID=44056 RepID=A0ABR1G0P6_AURAN
MGVTFSEPLEKLCLGVFVVFLTAAAVTYGAQASRAQRRARAARRCKPRRRPSGGARRKKKAPTPPRAAGREAPGDAGAAPAAPAAAAPGAGAGARPRRGRQAPVADGVGDDGRTYVDGVDLADIADPDVAPPLHAPAPVAAPWRGARGGDDGRAGA